MELCHKEKILRNQAKLCEKIQLDSLYTELLSRGIINHTFIKHLKVSGDSESRDGEKFKFFSSYIEKGPEAFKILIESLFKTGHTNEAQLLKDDDELDSSAPYRSSPQIAINGVIDPQKTMESSSCSTAINKPQNALSRSWRSLDSPPSSPQRNAITMEELPPLILKVEPALLYNNGDDPDECYQMLSNPRGFALLINNIEFPGDPLSTRNGAEKDSENLETMLKLLHFEVTIKHNVKYRELLEDDGIIDTFLDQFNNHDVDCCIVAFMSHGNEGSLLSADLQNISLWQDFIPKFNNLNCPALHTKPKIFIIQSCRGDSRDRGVANTRFTSTDSKDPDAISDSSCESSPSLSARSRSSASSNSSRKMPTTEDMLICQSTVPGCVSNRDNQRGTWYIDSLCQVLSERAHDTEILSILKKVGLRMRFLKSEYEEMQMSSFNNTGFHFNLYFNPSIFET